MGPSQEIPGEVTEEGTDMVRPPATFEGRLKLKDFMCDSPQALLRRSPRRAAASAAPASSSSRSLSPLSTTDNVRAASTRKRQSAASSSSSPSPIKKTKKRTRPSSGYAPPSTYAHLPLLPDAVGPDLLVLFIGLNPGIETARTGHAYAHPSNLFWKLLFSSGVTPRLCRADEDHQMPELYNLGLTNIVARPSRNGAELSKQEMDDGVSILDGKARRWRPESICVVGKSIWESIWRVRHGRAVGKDFKYGWQDKSENMGAVEGEWAGARIFVGTSTSGLAASLSPTRKQEVWSELGAWVMMRRAEREVKSEKMKAEEAE